MAQIVSSETLDYLTFKNPALIKVKFRLSEVWLLKLSGIKKNLENVVYNNEKN